MFLVAQHSQNEKFCYRVIVATQKLYELLPQEKAQSQQPTLRSPLISLSLVSILANFVSILANPSLVSSRSPVMRSFSSLMSVSVA
jgi:hypothetical protein